MTKSYRLSEAIEKDYNSYSSIEIVDMILLPT